MSRFPRQALRPLAASILMAVGLLAAAAASAQNSAPGADVASLLAYARQHNPELAAMEKEAHAATARVQPAGALPDPVLRVELENINNYGNDASPSLLPSRVGETKYTLMQQFPAWGKRDLRRGVAEGDARQAQARAAVTWAEQAMRIKTAYAQYYLAAHNERITRELLDLVLRLGQIAQTRYSGGLAPQQDAIRAQLEQTAMRAELINLGREKQQLAARINGLLGRTPAAPLAEPQALRPLPSPAALEAARLVERARVGNFAVQVETARVQSAEANRELTWRNRYPDLNVGISPTQMGSRLTAWGLMLEVNIPLQQNTRRSQEREALAMLDAARSRVEAAANQASADVLEQAAGLDAARRNEALIVTQQLPQSELVLQSALAAYETGKIDFATLLDAQREIRKARIERLRMQVEAQMRLAEIERTVGEDL